MRCTVLGTKGRYPLKLMELQELLLEGPQQWVQVATASVKYGDNNQLRLLSRASLVVQWLRICLPMQRTWI